MLSSSDALVKILMEIRGLWVVIVVVIFCQGKGGSSDNTQFHRISPEQVIFGVPGQDIELPCDVTPPTTSDKVTMVFWFKDSIGMVPLYSLDARTTKLSRASHLAVSGDLGNRLYFIIDKEPSKARLKIKLVNIHDEGLYRCRVDYVNSPTRNFHVNLSLVEQPSAPRIFDAEGREIKENSSAGPFLEGGELFLSCQVSGGRPRPSLSWWVNNTLLDKDVDSDPSSSIIVNQLLKAEVPRRYKGARLECRATSSENAGYIIRKISLVIFLKPDKVKIVSPNELMSYRKSQTVRCETSGSYPPAKLTWLLDGRPVNAADVTEEETETFTGSILTMSVSAEDDGKELVCKATNPHFPGGTAEDRRQIHVAYPPRVAVKQDSEVQLPAKEGANITLRCQGKSQPAPYSYRWYHDGHLVRRNDSSGVIPSEDSLTLTSIERKSGGEYACSATNSEGETYSAPFRLPVQYAPRCRPGYERMKVASVVGESLVIQCHVDAVPEVTRFSWTYNTSRGVLPVQGAKTTNKNGVSVLNLPAPSVDLESLSCWATNDVGPQREPCIFYVFLAEPPQPPRHCLFRNTSREGPVVRCEAGPNGGLHQTFVLELVDVTVATAATGVAATLLSDQGERPPPVYRVLGERPVFQLHGLAPGREYQALVFAENARGRSAPPEVLPNIKVPPGESGEPLTPSTQATNATSSKSNLTLMVVILSTCVVLLIVGIVAASAVLAYRRRPSASSSSVVLRRKPNRDSRPPDEFELNSEAGFNEGFHRRSLQYRASMYSPPDVESRISKIIEGPDLIISPVVYETESCLNEETL